MRGGDAGGHMRRWLHAQVVTCAGGYMRRWIQLYMRRWLHARVVTCAGHPLDNHHTIVRKPAGEDGSRWRWQSPRLPDLT